MRRRQTARPGRNGPGGSEEFDDFVARCVGPLTRAAVLITWNLADAEDVVQEALYRTAKHWHRVRVMAHPYAYTRRVVIHQALRGAEKRATLRAELRAWPEGMVTATPSEGIDFKSVELRLDLARVLGKLPARQRAVVVLRFAEQLTEAEVAELLGWPLGTVKSTAARALERLRSGRDAFVHRPVTQVSGEPPASPPARSNPTAPARTEQGADS